MRSTRLLSCKLAGLAGRKGTIWRETGLLRTDRTANNVNKPAATVLLRSVYFSNYTKTITLAQLAKRETARKSINLPSSICFSSRVEDDDDDGNVRPAAVNQPGRIE